MANKPQTMDDADLHVLSDLSIYNCIRFGPYKAVIYEDQQDVREYTNFDIAREAAQLAAGLQALGIEKGDRVIVMMLNSPEVVVAYQGISRAGGIIIPVLPLLKPPEVHYIAENSAARAIITSPVLLPMLHGALADVLTMQHIISTGDIGAGSAFAGSHLQVHAFRDVVAKGSSRAEDFLSTEDDVAVDPDDTSVILYTSGTTGRPKGVVITHRNLIANALSGRGPERDVRDQETQLAILPLAHAFGIVALNVFFLRGLSSVLHPRFDTNAVFSAIERHRIAGFAGVPAMFVALLYSPDADNYDSSSLQQCVSGSAPLPVAVLKGYYNMPVETEAAMRNGWLQTGDMGRFDEDGYLYIVERKKDLIIRGGF